MPRGSLRTRIFLGMTLLVGGAAAIALPLLLLVMNRWVEDEVKHDLGNSATACHYFLASHREQMLKQAAGVAEAPHLKATLGIQGIDHATALDIVEAIAKVQNFGRLRLFDAGGRLLADTLSRGAFGDSLIATDEGIRHALEGHSTTRFLRNQPDCYLAAVVPVISGREVLGVVELGHRVDERLADTLAKVSGRQLMLVAGEQVVATPSELGSHRAQLQRELAEIPRTADSDRSVEGMFLGARSLASIIQVDQEGLDLILFRSYRETAGDRRAAAAGLLIGALLIVSLAALLSIALTRRITRPLDELTQAATRVADGDLEAPVPEGLPGEIGTLAQALRHMLATIGELVGDVREEARRAELASTAKSRILQNMSHELRTPMNGIIGLTEALRGCEDPQERDELGRSVVTSASALLGLIDDILEYSNLEESEAPVANEEFELEATVEAILALFSPEAKKRGLDLGFQRTSQTPRHYRGDPRLIQKLLFHLVGNALKFTRKGRVTVSATHHGSAAGDELELTIEDSGIGIPEGKLGGIFDLFTQVEDSHDRSFGGTGLGLATCKRISERLRGDLSVTSEEGKGSIFRVRFPCAVIEKTTAPAAPPEPAAPGAPRGRGGDHRILVVEDNPVNQRVVRMLLEKMGFEVTVANHGGEALEHIDDHRYDLILMDCQMPVMDGYEATRRLRSEHSEGLPPIVALTANALPEDRQRCLDAGMDDYFTKPVRRPVLEECCRRWVPGFPS